MGRLNRSAIAIACAAALLSAGSAHADLLEYSFKGADGSQRSLGPSDKYANPVGKVTFALNAGLDRKVRISILNSAGKTVESKTSHLLGVGDRITVAGKVNYGALLTLNAPPEGTYKLKAEIISGDGKDTSIKADEYDWVVDTSKPTASNIKASHDSYGRVITGNIWKLGLGGNSSARDADFALNNIKSTSPIASTKLELYRENGKLYKSVNADYDAALGTAIINYKKNLFPKSDLDEVFSINFIIEDRAGNTLTTPAQKVMFDNVVNAPRTPFGVYNPSSKNVLGPGLVGFEPYKAGGKAHTNPVKLAWRLHRDNWHENRQGGLRMVNNLGGVNKVGEDNEYVYLVTSSPYQNTTYSGDDWRWVNFGSWSGDSISYNLSLAPNVAKSPKLLGIDYKFSDIGWSTMHRYNVDNSSLPLTIEGIRVKVEPRPYNQIASHKGTCTILAGDSSCEIESNTVLKQGTTGYIHDGARVFNHDRSLRSNPLWAEVNWNDEHYPELTQLYDEKEQMFTLFVNQPRNGAYFNRLRLAGAWIENDKGVALKPKGGLKDNVHDNYIYTWDLNTLPEGEHNLFAVAKENHGPTTREKMFSYISDKTPPNLNIVNGGKKKISTLDQLSVTITDNFDKNPKLTSILLEGGPANEKVQLSWRKQSSGVFKLEYPIMFPSLAEGETYKLTVKGQDNSGNQATDVMSFKYEPRTASLASGMDGKILIPATNQEFKRLDGGHVIQTEPITLSDGALVNGNYDVMASLRSDADVPLVVNGIEIQPGETMSVISQHNFSKSNGKIDLPVRAIKNGVAGKANLMIMTSAPNSPIVIADINIWDAKAKLSASSWEVRQIIDPVRVTASPETGTACRFTSDENTAKKADPIRDPVCLIEWDEKPEDVEQVISDSNGLRLASLRGQAARIGTEPISYSLYLFSGDGRKVKVGSGKKDLNVTSAMNSVTFKPRGEVGTVHRVIQDIDVSLEQATGPDCRLTTDDQRAQISAQYGSSEFSGHCLLEWLEIPDGMQQQDGTDRPVLLGRLEEEKKHTLNWRVSSFSKSGTRVTLAEESFDINAIDPPEPDVSVESALHFKDNIYMVPSSGGYLGDLYVLGEQANIDLLIKNGDTTDLNETFRPAGRFNNKIYRRLEAKQMPLWSETALDVTAKYTDLPSVTKTKSIKAISVPDYNVEPRLTIDETTVLDSVPLPVVVNMVNKLKPNQEYDESVIGQWEVRLGRDKGFNDFEPLTEFKLAENGEATFDADLTGSNRSAKLMAEARLVSPVKGYERSELSQRIFVTVLRGGEIESGIKSRRLSGPAPFTTVLQLDLKDSLDRTATGDVVWEVSKDDGESWETTKVEDRSRFRWHQSYDRGVYKVRAKTTNSNSGAEAYTETVEIIAYNVPKVDIEGPRTVFAGDEANYKVVVTDSEGNVLDDAVIKWSDDRGKTFTHEGDSITLASDNVERMSMEVWVRDSTAPDDDRLAYTKGRVSTDFKEIRKPKIYTTGPRIVEVGEEYEFSARINPPFRGMEVEMNGEFTLPNGEIVKGSSVKYTPTDEDLQSGSLELQYTAWVEGFKDEGAVQTQSVKSRVWKYVWPNFKLTLDGRTRVAPTEMDARTRTIGFRGNLDEVKYTWDIPEGVEVISDQWDEKRPLKFNTAGTFLIKAIISDARGNETVLEEEVEIAEADPFNIDVTTTTSNSFNRAPLELRLRPRVSGGHPRDRVVNLEYKVNGDAMDTVGQSARAVLDAGDYDIDIKATSLMGVETVETLNFSVNENKLPVCSINVNDRASSWAFFAECSDEDGKMKFYEWEVDGDKVSVRSNRLTLLKGSHDGIMPSVALVGYDDADGASVKVTAAPPAE